MTGNLEQKYQNFETKFEGLAIYTLLIHANLSYVLKNHIFAYRRP